MGVLDKARSIRVCIKLTGKGVGIYRCWYCCGFGCLCDSSGCAAKFVIAINPDKNSYKYKKPLEQGGLITLIVSDQLLSGASPVI